MIEPIELLRSYLQGIRFLSGAVSASLYVPPAAEKARGACLIHDGDYRPLPELEDLASARRWAIQGERWLQEADGAATMSIPIASGIAEGALFALPDLHSLATVRAAADAEEPETSERSGATPKTNRTGPSTYTFSAWLGLRFEPNTGSAREHLANHQRQVQRIRELSPADYWRWLFAMGGVLAGHSNRVNAALLDPTTGLLNRVGLQALLEAEVERAVDRGASLGLLLVNPDDFQGINTRFGRPAGERVLREIARRLRGGVDESAIVCRYGGASFVVLLGHLSGRSLEDRAERLRRQIGEQPFLEGRAALTFSCGLAALDPAEPETQQTFELLRRADESLQEAKRQGGATTVLWDRSSSGESAQPFDRLTGIFTGDTAQDYRNMALLWEAVNAVSTGSRFESLARRLVDQISHRFLCRQAVLFRCEGDRLEPVYDTRDPADADRPVDPRQAEPLLELLQRAVAQQTPTLEEPSLWPRFAAAFPVSGQFEVLGCLFVECSGGEKLGAEDLLFLQALAGQLGVALERALTVEEQTRRAERDRQRLEAEVEDLRRAVQKARLIFSSPEMEAVVETARRVASTDATVLITGSSGTGKDLLARTIHDLSERRDRDMVLVDCGAISPTLIESELFGHEKGAYTGAASRRKGRLAEAAGSTLFLDEVGELPMAVQSKLLRFVQEREFSAVGSSRTDVVDTRIIAATNRSLEKEVAAGRFREDLFYRLNVVRLNIPDLRLRPDDIGLLAEFFLQRYARQHDRPLQGFTPEALRTLREHDWPGNVRELQNRVLQATILGRGPRIDVGDLGLQASATPKQELRPDLELGTEFGRAVHEVPDPLPPARPPVDSALARLRIALGERLQDRDETPLPPLGRWLRDDVIRQAREAADGVTRRGAELSGLPESTFRRRLKETSEAVDDTRWHGEITPLLYEAALQGEGAGQGLAYEVERILLEEILEQYPGSTKRGAALLGVSAPTFRSRVARYGLERA